MDNLTHTLTGLMMARTGLGGKARGVAVVMMLAANAPDIDAVSWLGGTLNYLKYHRGFTHSLLFAPVLALVPCALVRWIGRSPLGWAAYLGSLAAVLSHLALDWTNVYGIRLFLPFSSEWLRLDQTNIVDPWILAIFALALSAPALVKLVSDEIGGRKQPGPRQAWAVFALVVLFVYECGRFSAHTRAVAMLDSHLWGGAPATRVTATPDAVNPLLWRGIVEAENFVFIGPVQVTGEFNPAQGRVYYPAESSPAMNAAKKTSPFEIFGQFDQLPYWKLLPVSDGLRVQLIDLRFGTPDDPGFAATALVEPGGHVVDSRFGFGLPR
jgi:inner membrane protein